MLGVGVVAAQFWFYGLLGGGEGGVGCAAADGALACLGAACVGYPGLVVKTRVMGGKQGEGCCLLEVVKEVCDGGREVLYGGFGSFVARSVPPTGVLFAVQALVAQSHGAL